MNSKRILIEESDSGGWIYTFADLMTLLLVFFVLMFSLSSIEKEKFQEAVRSLNMAFAGETGANSVIDLPHEAPVKSEVPEEIEEVLPATDIAEEQGEKNAKNDAETQNVAIDAKWKSLSDDLQRQFQVSRASDAVEIGTPKDGRMTIRVQGTVLFPVGSAEYNREMMPMLDSLVLTLKQNPDLRVSIQGHTDDRPIETARFPSNWELSAVRATNVLRYMIRGGISPERVQATGYGDSVPLVENSSEFNRAKNRRLEFVLERKE